MSTSYKNSGVDVEAGYEAVKLIKQHAARTASDGVLAGVGGFGALFEVSHSYKNPVLVSGTDGVGTKLKIAFVLDKHDTVGQDCVAMCVNDIACLGAKPAFFLDYIATSKLIPAKIASIVKGIADGCALAGCALIGGETAEMPGFYKENEYDMAGFSVGVVEKDKIIDGKRIIDGDVLVGISSSGVHSNGFSLVRKIFNINDDNSASFDKLSFYSDELGVTFAEELLRPTKIYVNSIMKLLESGIDVKGISHITGGGFVENIPRMLPKGFRAVVNRSSFDVLPIFDVIQRSGKLSNDDMYETFNMGVGLVFAVTKTDATRALEILRGLGEKSYVIGEVKSGDNGIDIF